MSVSFLSLSPVWGRRAVVLLLLSGSVAYADCRAPVGNFVSLSGSVSVQGSKADAWAPASLKTRLCEGDTIRVGDQSRAAVALINEAVLRIDQNTAIRLTDITPTEQETSFLDIVRGAFQSFSRKPKFLRINSPYLNGSVEGTEFVFRVENGSSSLLVLEGQVVASNDQGSASVAAGEIATATEDQAPSKRIVVNPRGLVQWSLYYPPILSLSAITDSDSPLVDQAAKCAARGDSACALTTLGKVVDSDRDDTYYGIRSAVLLSVGRVDAAREAIDAMLRANPDAALAYSLRSVIAVAQNDKETALADGQKAVELQPGSAAARIALSYAQQANVQLDAARDTLLEAVKRQPDNALAWARLAELQLSFGNRSAATDAAKRAVELQPNLSRTQAMLGFVSLTKIDMSDAKAAFDKAIALDNADPLPRLGLGLAKIGAGDLAGGRGELEAAVALDPNQAIIRSYLGKAYYEEKRDGLAEPQFSIAEQLDPSDPTPWFYSAIAKQTQNQPVAALHDMNRAIELNDNRAVYRSRLLLDSDLAARSASQARIYSDLGFQQLALVEGWKSVNTDPTNFSAHRFLADSYSALPNHEIARVSELLQSQLLQPLNMTPIQPQLAESNLFLISSGGAGSVSFNEFNPLFYRNGTAVQVSGMMGGNDTSSEELVVSGVKENVAYSVGGYHFETNGFRPNAYQETDLVNAFVQVELSPDTSVQAEYRYKNAVRGDVQMRFFPNEYYPGERAPEETRSLRLGLRHDLSSNSIVLASLVFMNAKYGDAQNPLPPAYALLGLVSTVGIEPQDSYSAELQHLYRASKFNLTTGIGHFERNSTATTITTNNILPPPFNVSQTTSNTDIKHTNAYAYSDIHILDNLTLILGLSAEFTSVPSGSSQTTGNDGNQYNPKFGLMWTPVKDTLVRVAAFRTVKRPVIANQTLEPTQVAGFNQFYDDYNNTVSRRYGAAVDQTFSPNLFGGLEVSRRDLDVPNFGATNLFDWQEDQGRAYLFWTPKPWLGLKAEYQFERLDRETLTDGVKDADTHRLLLGMKASLPSGWSVTVNPSYYRQKGTFESIIMPPVPAPVLTKGKDDFWVVDTAVNYRLPKRHGFVSAGVKNVFDQKFMYFDTNYKNATLQPDRMFFASVTLALP